MNLAFQLASIYLLSVLSVFVTYFVAECIITRPKTSQKKKTKKKKVNV